MKVVQFTIPVSHESTVVVQENKLRHYYNHWHRHREVQIEWVVDGHGVLMAGNHMQRFSSGDIYVIGANQPHIFRSDDDYFDVSKGRSIHSVSLFFDPEKLSGTILNLPEMGGIKRFVGGLRNGCQVPEPFLEEIGQLVRMVVKQQEGGRVASFIMLLEQMASVRNLKPLAHGNSEQLITDAEGIRMDRIFQFLMENYKVHIALDEVSDVASMTPQAFCRYFKKHTDKTFVEFLNEIRINESCKTIVSGKFGGFAEVSEQSGFRNVTSFNRVFKKVTGKSPGAYHRAFNDRNNLKEMK